MSEPIQPDLAYRMESVADPSLSPDGSLLAYSHAWFDQAQMESYSHIMVLSIADGRVQEFTQGKADSAPKFAHPTELS